MSFKLDKMKERPFRVNPNNRVKNNAASMHNGLMSSAELKGWDQCCGIHGAARERKGPSEQQVRHEEGMIKESFKRPWMENKRCFVSRFKERLGTAIA